MDRRRPTRITLPPPRPLKPASYRYPMCRTCGQRLKKLTELKMWCGSCQRAVVA